MSRLALELTALMIHSGPTLKSTSERRSVGPLLHSSLTRLFVAAATGLGSGRYAANSVGTNVELLGDRR